MAGQSNKLPGAGQKIVDSSPPFARRSEGAGTDQDFYETASGIVWGVAGFANDVTGTPPGPALRGDGGTAGTGLLPKGSSNRYNSVVKDLFMEKK